ncbi:MAG TPA: acyl-CoA dehydrogenase family protein [Acidimicrobiia bacterium]|nr:acyl-CoA dehydrogenase family protein [Acidimicrobiia bacterium]
MPLTLEERGELRSAARSLLGRDSSTERVRAAIARTAGFDRALWDQMVELGWTTIHVPGVRGGSGCGYADLGVVLHELGRNITPSPFLASAVLATGALLLADNDRVAAPALAAVTAGEALGAVALASTGGSYDRACLTTSWEGTAVSMRLQGSSGFVLDADVATVLVVAARARDGTVAVLAVEAADPRVRIERVATVDETRRLFTVSFDDVVVGGDALLCEPGAPAEELFERVLAIGVIATACDAAGVAERMLESAAEYAKVRTQFGKPIGSFQAVKHRCADITIAVEAARAATRAATETLDGDLAEWSTTAAVTSSYVGPACAEACAQGLLVHGGIGFTWEHDSHLYLKRAKLDEVLFGTPSWHRRRLADAVFPGRAAS